MNGFAVLDLETTGFSPARGHRIVEIGVVLTDAQRAPVYEWTTLVDPRRSVGPTAIHGVTPAMVVDAPRFGDVADDLALLLENRVLVAHNARFDVAFLEAEWRRLEQRPNLQPLCTMALARRRRLPAKLSECCAALGLTNPDEHRALGDARVTAQVLDRLDPRPHEIPPPVSATPTSAAWSGHHLPRTVDGVQPRPQLAPSPTA